MSKTVLGLTLLALALPLSGTAQARSNYLPRTERGQLAQEIVRRWSLEGAKHLQTSPMAWGKAVASAFAHAPIASLRRAAMQPTFEEMLGALQTNSIGTLGLPLAYVKTSPCRIANTRNAGGILEQGETRSFSALVKNGTYSFQGGSNSGCGLAIAPSVVVVRITAARPSAEGHLVAYPSGNLPETSSLNYLPGVNLGNEVHLEVSSGAFNIFTNQATHVVIDMVGYFELL